MAEFIFLIYNMYTANHLNSIMEGKGMEEGDRNFEMRWGGRETGVALFVLPGYMSLKST